MHWVATMWLADWQFVLPSNWTSVPNKVAGVCMCVYCAVAEPGGGHHWSKLDHPFGHPDQNSFCPLFLDKKCLYYGTGVFFCITSNGRLFRCVLQLCFSARRESNEHGKGTPAKWVSVEQWDAVRLYVSKTNFPVLSAVTVLTAHALIASS